MRATWYVLEDGNVVDPIDCVVDDKGVLRHKSGIAVAKRGDAYSSRGVDLDDVGAVTAAVGSGALADMTVAELRALAAKHGIDLGPATKKAEIVAVIDREMKAGGAGFTYLTR